MCYLSDRRPELAPCRRWYHLSEKLFGLRRKEWAAWWHLPTLIFGKKMAGLLLFPINTRQKLHQHNTTAIVRLVLQKPLPDVSWRDNVVSYDVPENRHNKG